MTVAAGRVWEAGEDPARIHPGEPDTVVGCHPEWHDERLGYRGEGGRENVLGEGA